MHMSSLVFRVPQDTKVLLQDIAWQLRIPASELLRQIVEDYLDKEGKSGKKSLNAK